MRPRMMGANPQFTSRKEYRGRVEPIFPTPLTIFQIDDIDHEEVIRDTRRIIEIVKEEHDRKDEQYTSYFSRKARATMYQCRWYRQWEDAVKETYKTYMENVWDECLDDDEPIHIFAWLNRYTKASYHTSHIHNGSTISGTWYIKADDSTSPIRFMNPQAAMAMRMNEVNYSEDTMEAADRKMARLGSKCFDHEVQIHPQSGDMLFWPAWLYHSVEPADETDNYERISLSFNLSHINPRPDNESDIPYDELIARGNNDWGGRKELENARTD